MLLFNRQTKQYIERDAFSYDDYTTDKTKIKYTYFTYK